MVSPAPISVVIPTIGRLRQLTACLESFAACDPRADEILVADQSGDPAVGAAIENFAHAGVRRLALTQRNRSLARNEGLRAARNAVVALTDDDCTVQDDWIGVAAACSRSEPGVAFTGRVLASGDAELVPSTIDLAEPRDYTGQRLPAALYGNNMILPREIALELGGFDASVVPAEDNDLSYRWLTAGHGMRHEPGLVVWHHDWRDREELTQLYRRYARAQGSFYAKHLRRGDMTMLRFIADDLYNGTRGMAARLIRGKPPWADERQGLLPGMPLGLVGGLTRSARGRDPEVIP